MADSVPVTEDLRRMAGAFGRLFSTQDGQLVLAQLRQDWNPNGGGGLGIHAMDVTVSVDPIAMALREGQRQALERLERWISLIDRIAEADRRAEHGQ